MRESMDGNPIQRITGATGVLATLLMLVELPLYFVYGGAPPDGNIFTRSLLGIVGATLMIVFMAGLPQLVKTAPPERAWAGTVSAVAGLLWTTIALVSMGLEVGAAIQAPEPIDPTVAVSGTYILYGSISKLLMALFLGAFAYAFADRLPRWTVRSAAVLAVVQLAFVPSLYFGNDPANFYAANGWGTTATMGGFIILWILAASIAILRTRRVTT
ncbi:hypothetical protein [Nocardia sp. NPDC052566]|uniref:hypothetical protein n=1 Tax=Nocardia sp. NPDC052566 TaxID=3364330 RepID=UPI0037C72341